MAVISVLLASYVKPTTAVSWIAYGATLTGVVLLLAATLVGRLGVGWYFLYPLPFHSGGTWPAWATASLFTALAIMGVGWTLWSADLLFAIARRYRLSHALGWHYLGGSTTPEVPPIIIISTVSLIGVLAGLVAAVVILVLVALEQLGGSGFTNDALLIKNLTFYFGHMVVNVTMYLGVAMVYEVIPAYSGRPGMVQPSVAVRARSAARLTSGLVTTSGSSRRRPRSIASRRAFSIAAGVVVLHALGMACSISVGLKLKNVAITTVAGTTPSGADRDAKYPSRPVIPSCPYCSTASGRK